MRKFFSLIAAVLFAGSMLAETVTLKVEDYAATEFTGSGISVSTAKNDGGNAPVYNATGKDLRVYAKGSVTISAQQNITAISFVISTQGKKRLAPLTASEGNVVVAGDPDFTAVWTGSATSVVITVGEKADYGTDGNSKAGQLDFTAIEVTLGEGGGETPGGDTPGGDTPGGDTPGGDTTVLVMTCAEAQVAALAGSTQKATVKGYVTEIAYAWSSGSMSFWMADTKDGGKVFEAYKCECAEADAPAVGDLVEATGNLTVYNKTTAELAAGCTVVIIKKASGDTPGGDTPGGDTPGGDTQGLEGITILPSDFTPVENADYSTTKEGVTIAVTASTVTADQMRIFKGQSITISAAANITGIEFTCTANGTAKYGPGCFAAQDGYSFDASGKTGTWKGSAKSVTFTAESNQVRAAQIVVALEGGDQPGGDTTVVPVDTTVVPGEAITCLEVYQMAKNDNVNLLNPVIVTYANAKNVWVRDGSASMLIYLPANTTWQAGDVLSGIAGVVDVYNGVHEIKPTADQVAAVTATPGEAPAAEQAAVVELTDVNKYIVMPNVAVEGTFEEGKQSNLTINGVAVRNQFKNGYVFEAGKTYNVYGVVTIYQNNPQVYFITAEIANDSVPVVPTMDYYVVGSMTNWGVNAGYKLKANPAQDGEYMADFTFAENDEFKVVYSDGSSIADENWFPQGVDNNYVITEAGNYTVYFRPDGQGGQDWHYGYFTAIKKETPAGPTNCAEAREAALSVSANNELYNNGAVYSIQGYVTAIQTAYNSQYNNITFWMADEANGGNVLEAFRAACASEADAPNVGDKVTVTGSLTKYNSTPEFAAGCTYVINERAEVVDPVNLGEKTIAEFLELKNTKDICILTGVVSNIKTNSDGSYNKYGNFDITDATGSVYVYGLLTPDGQAQKFQEMGIDEGDTLTLKAVYTTYNGKPQVANAVFVSVAKAEGNIPVGGDTIEINMSGSEVTYTDAVADAGWWQIEAENDDYYVTLSNGNSIAQAVGAYDVQDLDPGYSYILSATDSISFVSGSITLSEVDSTIVVAGQLVGSDGNTYVLNLVYGATGEQGEYTYDYEPTTVTTVNIVADTISISDYTADYGVVYITLAGANGNWASLEFIANSYAGSLPAGTYQINASEAVGTFFASPGGDDEYDYGCYVGVVDGENYHPYYMISGMVTIAADGGITVNATSYNGSTIIVTYTPQTVPSGISDTAVEGKAVKVLRNGHVQIKKGDKTFNVLGAQIR